MEIENLNPEQKAKLLLKMMAVKKILHSGKSEVKVDAAYDSYVGAMKTLEKQKKHPLDIERVLELQRQNSKDRPKPERK